MNPPSPTHPLRRTLKRTILGGIALALATNALTFALDAYARTELTNARTELTTTHETALNELALIDTQLADEEQRLQDAIAFLEERLEATHARHLAWQDLHHELTTTLDAYPECHANPE